MSGSSDDEMPAGAELGEGDISALLGKLGDLGGGGGGDPAGSGSDAKGDGNDEASPDSSENKKGDAEKEESGAVAAGSGGETGGAEQGGKVEGGGGGGGGGEEEEEEEAPPALGRVEDDGKGDEKQQQQSEQPSPAGAKDPPASSTAAEQTEEPRKKRAPLSVKDFEFGEVIGEGSFGRVLSCVETATGHAYAAKILEKKHILKNQSVKYVKMERDILNMLSHPNVIKLYCTFQDPNNLYLIMELAEGGELFQVLNRVTPEGARFYAAEIVSVLEYLDSHSIVHRDLKPENLLVAADGHLKLTDFGTAKLRGVEGADPSGAGAGTAQDHRNTFCGTPEYVSPEVLRDREATKAADLWALGCIVYQLIAHRPPFRAESEYLLFQKILGVEFEYPDGFPEDARDLVDNLLVLEPEKRLGMGPTGLAEVRAHRYFDPIDFAALPATAPPELLEETGSEDGEKRPNAPPKGAQAAGGEERARLLEAQADLPWCKFTFPNELIVRHGAVIKRKGLSSKRRQLVLTDYPRIFYVDPDAMEKKGDIPWSSSLRTELKGAKHFLIHTPSRTYRLECLEAKAEDWVASIAEMQRATSQRSPSAKSRDQRSQSSAAASDDSSSG